MATRADAHQPAYSGHHLTLDETGFRGNSDLIAYHLTDATTANQILTEGFDPAYNRAKAGVDEKLLRHVATALEIPLPVDRRKSSFFFLSQANPSTLAETLPGIAVVLNLDAVTQPMCIADHDKFDPIISSAPLNWPPETDIHEETIAVTQEYLQTMTAVQTPREIRDALADVSCAELIIEGRIPSEAVVTTLVPNWEYTGEFAVDELVDVCHRCYRPLDFHRPSDRTLVEYDGHEHVTTSQRGMGVCPEHGGVPDAASVPASQRRTCACQREGCPTCPEP